MQNDREMLERAYWALKGLLNDTQHKDHDCVDMEFCPVEEAKKMVDEISTYIPDLDEDYFFQPSPILQIKVGKHFQIIVEHWTDLYWVGIVILIIMISYMMS